MNNSSLQSQEIPFWRDERYLQILGQVIFTIAIFGVGYFLYRNMIIAMGQRGLLPSFDFLRLTSGFDIGHSLVPYDRAATNGHAFFVGVLNTLLVSLLGIIFATFLGVIIGVSRLSRNFLLQKLSSIYIEILRNIPLLVLLLFWYRGVFLVLPKLKENPIILHPTVAAGGETKAWLILSNRGTAIAWGVPTASFSTYVMILAAGLVAAIIVGWILTIQGRRTGRPPLVTLWSLVTFVGVAVVGWFLLPQAPVIPNLPFIQGLNTREGLNLAPEFMAVLSGLVIYTAAFIGEVVRAGLQAVTKGQVEAAHALGLGGFQTLRFVVFPQALRVIIPPLTSQYLNLAKNSSLAVAIGFPDLFSVSGTIFNQTGRSVEVILIVMGFYLSFSLLTSFFMNWYNRRIRFVER